METIVKRSRPDIKNILPIPTEEELGIIEIPDDDVEISKEVTISENQDLNEAYANLNSRQIMAARLESCGITDTKVIASRCKVHYQTVIAWRSSPYYKKLISANNSIVDKISREVRIRSMKNIINPVYAELISRMQDPNTVEELSLNELQAMLVRFNKEIRSETIIEVPGTSLSDIDEGLGEILKSRKTLMYEQKLAIEELNNNGRIIEFTQKAVVNG